MCILYTYINLYIQIIYIYINLYIYTNIYAYCLLLWFLSYLLTLKPETSCDHIPVNNHHFFLLKHVNFLCRHRNFQSWAQKAGALGTAFYSPVYVFSPVLQTGPQAIFGVCPEEEVDSPPLVQALVTFSAVVRLQTPPTLLPLLFSLSLLLSCVFTSPSLSVILLPLPKSSLSFPLW